MQHSLQLKRLPARLHTSTTSALAVLGPILHRIAYQLDHLLLVSIGALALSFDRSLFLFFLSSLRLSAMATATQSVRGTNPVAATYDQGSDIQPAVSWSNPNKDSYPASSATSTTTKVTTTTTASTATTAGSTTAALEKNLNPLDKEDPRLASVTHPASGDYEHNGNILDRTMDQIRAWVHSFNQDKQQTHYYDEHSDRQQPTTMDSAKARLADVQQQASSTFNQYSTVAADKAHAMQDAISRQAGGLQAKVGDVVHTVSDRAAATAGAVKQQVNEFIATHQTSGEQLSTSISNQLPSADAVKQRVSAIVPPLAQQASTSYAFLGSFLTQYLSTYRDFVLAMRRQSLPLQAMTALLVVTHFVLPWFFVDKSAARSVLSCFVVSSVLSHLTYFLSGHLRYMFLAHLVFVPMLISLTLHAGFSEAGQVSALFDRIDDGNNLSAAAIAPFSVRSYTYILWLRLVLMVQASLLTLDAVNVLDLLGFSLETRRGQEMTLINRSVQQMRRNFAHSVAPPSLASPTAAPSRTTTTRSSSSSQSDEQPQQQHVVVQSEEQLGGASSGLRARKPTAKQTQQQHPHPTVYVNEERVM